MAEWLARAPDLKSGGRGFKSHCGHIAGVVSW